MQKLVMYNRFKICKFMNAVVLGQQTEQTEVMETSCSEALVQLSEDNIGLPLEAQVFCVKPFLKIHTH